MMDYKTQKLARILTSAIIMMLCVSLIFNILNKTLPDSFETNNIFSNISQPSFYYLCFVFIAYFYNRIISSKIIYKLCFADIDKIIASKMVSICKQYNNSISEDRAKDIFYILIDNDNNLTIKSEDIRLNGYMISMVIDVLLAVLVLFPFYVFSKAYCCCHVIVIFLFLFIILFALIILLKSIHKELTSKQLKRIQSDLKSEIRKICLKKDIFKQILEIFINDK